MSSRLRSRCVQGLAAYLLFLSFVLVQRDASLAMTVVQRCSDAIVALGLPIELAMPIRVEFMLNVAMVVPVALLLAVIFPRHPWANWVVYGFIAACSVELFQGLFRPLRSAQFVDVVANTTGVLIGALISLPVVLWMERRGSWSAEQR